MEQDLRRARRALWAFRLVFYPGAVIAAVLLLAGRSEGETATFLDGTTSQRAPVELRLEGDTPTSFGTRAKLRCPGGGWWISWYQRLDDGRLRVEDVSTHRYAFHDQTSRRIVRLDARLDGRTLRGTLTAVEQFDGPEWGRYACESGAVTFSGDRLSRHFETLIAASRLNAHDHGRDPLAPRRSATDRRSGLTALALWA